MPTIQQLAAKLNRDVAAGLKRNAAAMPADRVSWKPMDVGRSALDQVAECALIARFGAGLLTDRTTPQMDMEAFQKARAELDTVEKAAAALDAGTDALCAAIEAFPAADLDKTIQLPWFGEPSTFAEIMFLSYWNSVYHVGQIAYIQTLYGDKEMH
jgi:hypothetical protein